MNLALRAVHDALGQQGEPAERWRSLVAELADRAGSAGVLGGHEVQAALRSSGLGGTTGEWIANLRLLGVLSSGGALDEAHAEEVGTALDLAADSFDVVGTPPSWAPVVTLPSELRVLLNPPPIRQTAGVLLELVDSAQAQIRLAAPYVDPRAVRFLSESLIDAGGRGVAVSMVTSEGQAALFGDMAREWVGRGGLRVTEVRTALSPIGSHAKVLVVDDERGYVGSANLTAAGLGRHVEIGVELAGPQVAELTRILVALERVGTRVLSIDARSGS